MTFQASVAEWLASETHYKKVEDRIRDVVEFLQILGLFLIFLLALRRAAFCVFSVVFAK